MSDVTTVTIRSRPTSRWKPLKLRSLALPLRCSTGLFTTNSPHESVSNTSPFSRATVSHTVSNFAGHRMGNRCDLVGRDIFAVPMILAERAGRRPPLPASELVPSIAFLLAFMAAIAVLSGITGYVLARNGVLDTNWLTFSPLPARRYRFIADWWAHTASYGAAFVGGVALCAVTYRRRLRPMVR
jgi:hypothetical protein